MRANVAMADYILVRVFAEEKRTLKETARKKGTSISSLIRDAVLDDSRDTCEGAA